jgi:cardiolipin synthase
VHQNQRTPRKLLIVAGRIAYAGGKNIVSKHHAGHRGHTGQPALQDIHFRFKGPVTTQLEQVFIDDWNFAGRRPLALSEHEQPARGEAICRTLVDGPNKDLDTLPMVLTGVISSARRRVTIMTPYFLPPRELISALQAAALRGVQVDVILPKKSNLRFVDWACRRILPELLQRGVHIHYQPPPFAHSKLCLVDDWYCLVGSANLDPRSLTLNFEVIVEVFDRALNTRLSEHCESVTARSQRLTMDKLQRQSTAAKLRDAFFWLFTSYL